MSNQPKETTFSPDSTLARAATLTGVDKEEVYIAEDVKEVYQHDIKPPEESIPYFGTKARLNLPNSTTGDYHMLPMLTLCLLINYLDRSNVTNARVAGMQKDLKMNDVQWSAGISMFYVGYMITQLPGCFLLSRGKPRIIMPLMVVAWSLPTILFPLAKNAEGFILARFAVGFAEGAFFPGIALMTSSWYTREELPFRMALWHGAPCLSNVFGGPIAAGVLETMEGKGGLRAWQWFMLIEGIISLVVAALAYWSLPNWANNTPWMSAEETEMAQYRLVMSAGGIDEVDSNLSMWQGLKLALKDVFTYIFVMMHLRLICAQSFKDFLPSILQTMSRSNLMTYLLQSPPYLCGFLAILGLGYTAGKYKENTWHMVVPLLLSFAGALMMILTYNVPVRYTGVCFLLIGTASALNLHVSWETSLVPSPRHKKAALIALANTFSSTSHWWTPYFFLTNQKPLYRLGGGLILVSLGISILCVLFCAWWAKRKNRALDEAEAAVNAARIAEGRDPLVKGWRYPL